MVSTLLDELPCLIDEADELMARLSYHSTGLKTQYKGSSASSSDFDEIVATDRDVVVHYARQDLKQPPSPRQSSASTQSVGKGRSMAEARQALETVDVEAVVKFFARQFLTMQTMSIDKMNANLPPGDAERAALHSVASSIYHLMKRLHHWQQAAWESLSRFFADNCGSEASLLTFDSHPQLTRLVLATVAKYVKLNLLWTSFREIPGLLALYSFLHHAQTTGDSVTAQYSPLESTDHRVREFVLHFGTAPLLAIQHDFQAQVADKGASLAALALSCFERYEGCHDLAKLRHQGVFDLEALVSGAYASHSSLPDLLDAVDVADWVICVVLCVPHQLQSAVGNSLLSPRSTPSSPTSLSSPTSPTNAPSSLQLWDFMEIIARDRLVLTLHRNHVVNLHNLLYQQLTSSLSASALTTGAPSTSMPSFRSSRLSVSLKKTMSALSKHALRNCGVNHRQRREVAVWLLQNCVQLMQHNRGLVAPSFPLLLAALAIARDEVDWTMSHGLHHMAALLPAHVKAKHLHRVLPSFSGAERELAELLSLSHRLRGLLEVNSHFLADYYQTFLVDGDAEGIAFTIQELFTAIESTPSKSAIQPLLEGFLDSERYRVSSSASPRVTWVREWRQANAHLVTGSTQLPLLDVLRARMECAVRHTQYFCVSSQLVEHAASFSKCWWFRDFVFEQCFDQTVAASPSASIALVEILSSLAAGNYIVDELVDIEEAAQHLERMLQRIDRMRSSLVKQVELGLEAVVKRDVDFQRDELAPAHEEKSEQVEPRVTASSRKLSSFSRVQSSQVQRPSNAELRLASPTSVTSSVLTRNSESVSVNNSLNASVGRKPETIADEERYLELVRSILDHIAQNPQGRVLKTAIVNQVHTCFVRFLRGFVVFPTGSVDAAALRCSLKDACEQIHCFLRVVQRLFGASGGYEPDGGDKVLLGEAVHVVLTKALKSECDSVASVLPQDKRLLEWTTDAPRVAQTELQAWSLVDRVAWLFVSLVTRCHPSASSSPVLASVRISCFVLAATTSREIDPRDYTDGEALHHLVGLIGATGLESICSTISNLLVAQVLKLRSSIEAEHAVLAFMDMALSGGTGVDVALTSAQTRALDDIATQLIQIGTAAFLLKLLHRHSSSTSEDAWEARVAPRVLHELQQDPDRRASWTRLLPVACSSAFHASVWRRTRYLSDVAATDTNAHMMGLAMARLLPSPAVHRCAVAALKRASTCSVQPSTSRSKLDPSSSESPARPLLEALELLVSTAASGIGDVSGPHGSELGELELVLERLVPRALLVLHSPA
ncbi:hypothetical protein PF008_g76 [Phytophthora fragariae]|uniref:Uncharacterized protein n=1 Tax=Phytophthora fragariae TaxID=53985 RepID=A0A6G0SR11_9STRA|nr:hypothetical protein PF008_g76 [Phytophthora fragariae]